MSGFMMLQKFEESAPKTLAPVIPIQLANKKKDNQGEKHSKAKVEKKIPLFYTEPIFKPKNHDFM